MRISLLGLVAISTRVQTQAALEYFLEKMEAFVTRFMEIAHPTFSAYQSRAQVM
jgi:hypothetical protein